MRRPYHHRLSHHLIPVALALAATSCADERDLPALGESAQAMKNGIVWNPWTEDTQTWTRNIVRVSTPRGSCTGTLLDYEWVISASHCVYVDTAPGEVRVRHTLADGSVEDSLAVELIIHPDSAAFGGDESTNADVVLFRLEHPLTPGVASLPISTATTAQLLGDAVFCAGYGKLDSDVGNDGKLRAETFTIIADAHGGDPGYFFELDVPNPRGAVLMPGDSGSSCWNGSALVGVFKAGNGSNYNRHSAPEKHRAWVESLVTPPVLKSVNQPAAFCKGIAGAQVDYTSGAQLMNPGTGAIDVLCPITRPHSPQFADFASVPRVWVFDRHPTQDVCCSLQSINPGGAQTASATVCSSGSDASYQTLVLPSVRDPFTFSQLSVQCSIPGAVTAGPSGVHGYRAQLANR